MLIYLHLRGGAPKHLRQEGYRALIKTLLSYYCKVVKRLNKKEKILACIVDKLSKFYEAGCPWVRAKKCICPQNYINETHTNKCFTLAEDATHINRQHNYSKCAFTLAEVLITLGIIGVVAAMTLPALINNTRNKELEAGLKRSYSLIGQALEMYQAENGERLATIGQWELKGLLMPYFKVLRDCHLGYNEENSCIPYYDQWGGFNPDDSSTAYQTYSNNKIWLRFMDDGQFVLVDGSLVLLENTNGGTLYITVDVNGFNKKPNKWGHDLFTFQIMRNGKILPMGSEGTDFTDMSQYCSVTSMNRENGIACTYKALTEKDYFKNLPK